MTPGRRFMPTGRGGHMAGAGALYSAWNASFAHAQHRVGRSSHASASRSTAPITMAGPAVLRDTVE